MLKIFLPISAFFSLIIAAETLQNENGPRRFTGLYSGELDVHAVVLPSRLDTSGNHVSSHVEAYHYHPDAPTNLRYKLPLGEAEHLTLNLTPSLRFISPHLVIEHRRGDFATRTLISDVKDGPQTSVTPRRWSQRRAGGRTRRSVSAVPGRQLAAYCHYQGHVEGHANSRVAVSLCNGLTGLIVTDKHGEFWVEPAKEHESSSSARPHVVFKRTTTVPESKKKKRKKKKKHEKNCGTRQPRRQTEMRLEWQQQPGKVKVKGRGRSRKSRWRRSVSRERHVEALVVADNSMIRFHEDTYVDAYILTIMNMVSSLYQDPSIGNQVSIVVVNIILLEDEFDQEGLNVTVNADKTLESFCKWQELQNQDDENHPLHHDVAILITREDICARQNTPCGTLGVAHVGGMCQKERSCNVNEDNGITLAHTITHELGHKEGPCLPNFLNILSKSAQKSRISSDSCFLSGSFGMYHDTEKIGCSRRQGTTQHVMTPSFEADTVEIAWSPCSRRDITNFLDKGHGSCLEDEPTSSNFSYPDLPAGAMYDADFQCQLQFGSKSSEVCSPIEEICSRLWCVVDGVCTTMLKPAAPGTGCGKHMWCQNQQCVLIGEQPEPINGGWSDWSDWSECSRSCGAGVTIKERFCNHPPPAFGGKFCTGERRRYKVCNINPCADDSPSFRSVQCSSFDNQTFHGKKYKWVPYFDKVESCELFCADTEDTIIVPWGDSALDGTPCRVGTRDMCIRGICKRVGCDWLVDSDAQEDKCGICHGNGDQCDTISAVNFKEEGSGYEEIATIPAGARNIFIEELGASKNYIGIGSETSEEFYLNGKLEITISGEYTIGGASGLYERDKDIERVHIPGPTKEGIIVYVIYRGKYKNEGVAVNYTIPKPEVAAERQYEWVFSDWSACSATCSTGVQTALPVCKERTMGKVEDSKCLEQAKPDNKMRLCNTHPCPTRWWTGPWQLCPATCGDSGTTNRKRTVLCVERPETEPAILAPSPSMRPQGGIEYVEDNTRRYTGQELALPDEECEGQTKPAEYEPCPNLPPCLKPVNQAPDDRFDNDFTDQMGQNFPKKKYEFKGLNYSPKKALPKKQKKRRKKERVRKVKSEDVAELNVVLRKSNHYKHLKAHTLSHMRYNAESKGEVFF